MRTRIDARQLRRHVVRIDRVDGTGVCGTGFFVAPGWVLTAAHVVYDDDSGAPLSQVMVVPADPAVGEQGVRAEVASRSVPPVAPGGLWPFPDLALLQLQPDAEWVAIHPCVWLVGEDPLGETCHAFGFPPRDEGIPPGAPASFVFEGVTGDGFLQLKAGQAAPGLSGAPLVCPARRAVVGVVTATRDRYTDLGGWAAPVAALLPDQTGGLPGAASGVSDDLATLGGKIAAAGQAAVLAARSLWHAVLPVDGAERLVDQPWIEAQVTPGVGQPSTMLRPEFAVVDYLFRGDALDVVAAWCEQPERLSVRYIDAAGGAGKTRFAIEACRAQRAHGWVAGLLPATGGHLEDLPLPRLLVVDYVEERDAEALAATLTALSRPESASALAPVRVLLLSRPAAGTAAGHTWDPLRAVAAGATLMALDAATDTPTAVTGLTSPQRHDLFTAGLTAFGQTWHGPGWTAPQPTVQLTGPHYDRPLDVLLEAFDAALSGPHWKPDSRPPVDRALDHEARRWTARLPDLDPDLLRLCVALATLAGARDDTEAHTLLDLIPDLTDPQIRSRVDQWLHHLYPGPDRWNPLRPDRLGEALIAHVLTNQPDGGLTLLHQVLDLPSDAQVVRALDVLVRLATHHSVVDTAATAFANRYTRLTARLLGQSSSGEPGR
ncbi:trypsin-like serine peptidase [Catenuloplanes atrovinosus]|uniref:Trypsin-like peptidase domain-containing protein n=1 Tax=Catenuloplanes atrovinosus TaxID=137266 RepID=A0AAE3YQD5_9ACTN|nr:trypsin-like peptidase domain-containing protein [Catenuloplanes atrovinosus]MDR7277745.1 hypothetical protein [Catenuloplanes atrovinosus]